MQINCILLFLLEEAAICFSARQQAFFRGHSHYVDDLQLPGMLYGDIATSRALSLSPHQQTPLRQTD